MKFELSKSFVGVEEIPSLIIAASDIIVFNSMAKDEKKLQKINEEYYSFQSIIAMYTTYCGRKMFIPRAALRDISSTIGKDGDLVINCVKMGEDPEFCCRWIAHGKENILALNLFPVVG